MASTYVTSEKNPVVDIVVPLQACFPSSTPSDLATYRFRYDHLSIFSSTFKHGQRNDVTFSAQDNTYTRMIPEGEVDSSALADVLMDLRCTTFVVFGSSPYTPYALTVYNDEDIEYVARKYHACNWLGLQHPFLASNLQSRLSWFLARTCQPGLRLPMEKLINVYKWLCPEIDEWWVAMNIRGVAARIIAEQGGPQGECYRNWCNTFRNCGEFLHRLRLVILEEAAQRSVANMVF